ncbi:zinc finger protein 676-like [Toxorhynchites rutilus septentrionalis]|uniref:zinc finger protein 676-like n=1 Tax=Toxorhynchites rutilus septentrionalis TaxID=329112 RepID=UPI00247AB822|nr:zinc finger protein 676-like [Toxorhynchites rutilus septentrionalis]XP_055645606.1 zinc finger protein 676-like [Toxorhynchites rutilus septentrionalis]
MEPYRNAINDPHQCRLCLRVCDDTFLESIFSEKEYSIAHQIFECTSIRVNKQDNLTKICRNCATLLFITTEFRNACFKTNRLLMEDFVILEVGEWTEESSRRMLVDCTELIVKHKQQVDYLYASIVPDSEAYLAGSLEIEREIFNSVSSEKDHRLTLQNEDVDGRAEPGLDITEECEPEEPDPEIIKEITKFLEGQQTKKKDGLCQICSLDAPYVQSEDGFRGLESYFKSLSKGTPDLRVCEFCQQILDMIILWQSLVRRFSSKSLNAKALIKLNAIKGIQRHLLIQIRLLNRQLGNGTLTLQSSANKAGISKRRKVICSICGKQIDSWKMKAHLNDHENKKPHACDQVGCSSAFSGTDLLNRHKKIWHSDYFYKSCPTCGKKCKTQEIFKTHVSYHEEPSLPCEICGKLLRNRRSMWKHMKYHDKPEDRKHVCDICNKRFAVAYTLRVHKRIHTNEKPFSCPHCEKRFQYKCLLKNHTEKSHQSNTQVANK